MGGIIWSELFPTRLSVFIFIGYMGLFVSQGILVTASQDKNNKYSYNIVTVVLLTELLKLCVSTILYCTEHDFKSFILAITKGAKVLLLYFVPAFLYCLYNNLSFLNLSTFDPTTYFLLLQLRVVITGILFQVIFKKYLSKKQWISLFILTGGCMLKQLKFGDSDKVDNASNVAIKNSTGFDLSWSAVLILIQIVCSCLAGVYNEYLLKDRGSDVNIYIQNVFMYLDSIVCNGFLILLQGNFSNTFSFESLNSILQFRVILIMINNAAIGIVTSFFLKHMNSILKTFASALELVFTAILSYIFFSIPIYMNTIVSISVVSFAIYLYSQNPVVNTGKGTTTTSYKLLSTTGEEESV